MIKIDVDSKYSAVKDEIIKKYASEVKKIDKELHDKALEDNNMLGWINLPFTYDKMEFEKIKRCAKTIRENSDVFVVIGIGGSYLGARAVIEALNNNFYNMQDDGTRLGPRILYVGNNLSGKYIEEMLDFLADKDVSINVISKSGTTTEPAIAFRIFREFLENKYGIKEAAKRIYVTTDKDNGALRNLCTKEKYESFVIPNNVGGRFSVLTSVGLLPVAVSGIDIDELMAGATLAADKYTDGDLKYNECYRYAVIRNIMLKNKKNIEIFETYEPKLHYFIEWLKQLFGESEGKDKKGIFPAGCEFSTDLHSLGQYIQEGQRIMFETVLDITTDDSMIKLNKDEDDLDNLNYLEGKSLDEIKDCAMQGTIQAHFEGEVPNIKISVSELSAESMGHLIYFFELACAMSATILGVDPFNQPGVEKYKTNMFKLLGKPGYEK